MSNQNYVFVIDTNQKPLNPCKPGVARSLLKAKKAAVFRRYPFTIILNKAVEDTPKPMQLKFDPGSKITGIALLQEAQVIWIAELTHRGQQIKKALSDRKGSRRSRRNRHTRYRQSRWLNRRNKKKGWLAPSLKHRVLTIITWVTRLMKLAPIAGISMELVRFDTQLMQDNSISGVEYQQGELAGYEVREYLLEKWGRQCIYCGKTDTPLEVEHIHPKSKGGSDRVSNLTLACNACNVAKGNQDIRDFLKGKTELLNKILSQAKQPLKDAAAVNSTRWALFNALKQTGLPVETGSGGKTKYNRIRLNLQKSHAIDAACVGDIDNLEIMTNQPLLIKATGHGNRQMCGTNKHGFPIRHRSRVQIHKGFQTGDIIKAVVTKGKRIGSYVGRVLCRATGSFDISTKNERLEGISYKYCKAIHLHDGYAYCF